MSWAVTRSRFPARRTLPSSTAVTLSRRPISRTSTSRPLKANAEVREATRRPSTRVSALISSSVMPSLKNSFSGSALMLTNGRTATAATRGTTTVAVGAGVGVGLLSSASASVSARASSAADGKRSSGRWANDRATSSSTAGGTDAPAAPSLGAGPVMRWAMRAIGVLPVNGGCPASISNSTQPSA